VSLIRAGTVVADERHFVSKQRLCFEAQAHHESCNTVKLAQEILRKMRAYVVSLSFLNLFCVNVFFEVKLHGAVRLPASRLGGTDVLLARDSYAGASH
jgi:hypothetical protein